MWVGLPLLQSSKLSLRSQIPDSLESRIMIMLTIIATAIIAGTWYTMCTEEFDVDIIHN